MRLPNLRSRAGNASARPRRGHPEHQRVKPSPGNAGGHTTLHRRRKQPTAEAQVDTGRADGVMLLLSPAIDKKTIRWKEHLKGRLIQASFSWHGARVHVLIAYQHVWSSQKSVHQNKEDRAKLLGSLASALRAIPARDTLLLAGDFNAQLHASQNLVGRSSTPKENTGVRDESFQRFVESHRLVALNTWSSGRGHTYVQGESRTQIDYIFTFPNSSRGQAKQAKPAPHLGLGGWKKGGHIPILATVRPVRHWNLPKESCSAPLFCASSLEAAVRAHSPQAQAMQTWVDSQLQSTALPPDLH